MNTPIQQWQEKKLLEGRAAGTVCQKCTKEIEKSRIEWAKKHNYAAPKFCLTCSKENTKYFQNYGFHQ